MEGIEGVCQSLGDKAIWVALFYVAIRWGGELFMMLAMVFGVRAVWRVFRDRLAEETSE